MLRFRIGSIPVEVRPSHLAIAALLAWSWMPGARSGEQVVPAIAVGAIVVFISILVHELGHAVVARIFGYQPAIVIEWFGGHTMPNADGPIPWWKDILLTFAGPLFGLLLAVAAIVALVATGAGLALDDGSIVQPLWVQALRFFALANLVWAVLNLVPVLPLDGGRISNALFTRVFGPKGVLVSQSISLLFCVAAIAFGLAQGFILLVIFFGMWGFSALRIVSAHLKGEGGPMSGPHPADLAFAQAAALFSQGKYLDARTLAERTLHGSEPLPTPARSRLHHLLGWIAIKEGEGRTALDHFSQMKGEDAEPQALAAAFALVGDDERALSLWELAYRTTNDGTVKNEWAGTLIRLGRVDEARKVARGDMAQAWRAAETTLVRRGDFAGAARVGVQALEELPAPELAYDTACSFARAGDTHQAQRLLDRAYELGFRNASHAQQDPDLAALRHSPEFTQWLRRVQDSAPR